MSDGGGGDSGGCGGGDSGGCGGGDSGGCGGGDNGGGGDSGFGGGDGGFSGPIGGNGDGLHSSHANHGAHSGAHTDHDDIGNTTNAPHAYGWDPSISHFDTTENPFQESTNNGRFHNKSTSQPRINNTCVTYCCIGFVVCFIIGFLTSTIFFIKGAVEVSNKISG